MMRHLPILSFIWAITFLTQAFGKDLFLESLANPSCLSQENRDRIKDLVIRLNSASLDSPNVDPDTQFQIREDIKNQLSTLLNTLLEDLRSRSCVRQSIIDYFNSLKVKLGLSLETVRRIDTLADNMPKAYCGCEADLNALRVERLSLFNSEIDCINSTNAMTVDAEISTYFRIEWPGSPEECEGNAPRNLWYFHVPTMGLDPTSPGCMQWDIPVQPESCFLVN